MKEKFEKATSRDQVGVFILFSIGSVSIVQFNLGGILWDLCFLFHRINLQKIFDWLITQIFWGYRSLFTDISFYSRLLLKIPSSQYFEVFWGRRKIFFQEKKSVSKIQFLLYKEKVLLRNFFVKKNTKIFFRKIFSRKTKTKISWTIKTSEQPLSHHFNIRLSEFP